MLSLADRRTFPLRLLVVMKIFNKGQVVIPAAVRREFGIAPGDPLEVTLNRERGCIELRPAPTNVSTELAGSLARYAEGKRFPTETQIQEALSTGMANVDAAESDVMHGWSGRRAYVPAGISPD
jgi:AbrB family looped-hinge helix DNA binding protein